MKHFELTEETMTTEQGVTLHRIRALKDLPLHGVKAGYLGGWIEKESNLEGEAWVGDEAWVYGNAQIRKGAIYESADMKISEGETNE